ncbi:MAG: MotA/TolQ/ExbB proton channel family protein [Bdellovibrionales bacterium]|nr:MotA/TolQ/ExbB proton channel family protein [Bdellovibrionales bacterium]
MDIATVVGLIGGLAVVGAAIVFGGSPVIFVNIPSFLIVIVGSIFVVAMKFSVQKLTNAVAVAMKAFFFTLETPEEIIIEAVKLAKIARKDGPLGLEKTQVANKFLARGVRLVVDNTDADVARQIMDRDRISTTDRHGEGQEIFNALNDVAPAMGMIGTLIGLVQMLSNMSDPKSIGPAMAVALLTTLYGAIVSNMIAKPIADKLSLRANEEEFLNTLCIDAIHAIGKGYSPMIVEESLVSYLSLKNRDKFAEEKDELLKASEAKAA